MSGSGSRRPRELRWGVKTSFLAYLERMPDGAIDEIGAAVLADGVVRFPAAEGDDAGASAPLRFAGGIRCTGHAGMLDLAIADPWLEEGPGGRELSIADPYAPGARVALATVADLIAGTVAGPAGAPPTPARRGTGLALTAAGADLFFGPYEAGTPLDDFVIVG